jgi:hypothetical protein
MICKECNLGIKSVQLADGSVDIEPCQCSELNAWYNLHAIMNEEE